MILFDDCLTVRAQKTKTVLRKDGKYASYGIGLRENWRKFCSISHENGEPVLLGWLLDTEDGKKFIKYENNNNYAKAYEKYGDFQKLGKRVYQREYQVNEWDKVLFRFNEIDILMRGLSYTEARILANRYSYLVRLHRVISEELFEYDGKNEEKNKIETFRLRLKRRFFPVKYETDILISDKHLSASVFNECEAFAKGRRDGAIFIDEMGRKTIYIKGFENKESRLLKVYDMGFRSPALSGLAKIEITFKRKDFERKNLSINRLTTQENILKYFLSDIVGELLAVGGENMAHVATQIAKQREEIILARIIRLEQRANKHDEQIADIYRRIKELENQKKDN